MTGREYRERLGVLSAEVLERSRQRFPDDEPVPEYLAVYASGGRARNEWNKALGEPAAE